MVRAITSPRQSLVEYPPLPVPIVNGPGFIIGLTRHWPSSDLIVIESLRRLRTLLDTDGDGHDDCEVGVSLMVLDLNADGVIEREVDALLVTPEHVRRLTGECSPLEFDEADRLATARRVVKLLAGV